MSGHERVADYQRLVALLEQHPVLEGFEHWEVVALADAIAAAEAEAREAESTHAARAEEIAAGIREIGTGGTPAFIRGYNAGFDDGYQEGLKEGRGEPVEYEGLLIALTGGDASTAPIASGGILVERDPASGPE